jgi:hypothetical protein
MMVFQKINLTHFLYETYFLTWEYIGINMIQMSTSLLSIIFFGLIFYGIYNEIFKIIVEEPSSGPVSMGKGIKTLILGEILILLMIYSLNDESNIIHYLSSFIVVCVVAFLTGFSAANTFENVKLMNAKILAVVGFLPHVIMISLIIRNDFWHLLVWPFFIFVIVGGKFREKLNYEDYKNKISIFDTKKYTEDDLFKRCSAISKSLFYVGFTFMLVMVFSFVSHAFKLKEPWIYLAIILNLSFIVSLLYLSFIYGGGYTLVIINLLSFLHIYLGILFFLVIVNKSFKYIKSNNFYMDFYGNIKKMAQ